MPTITKKFTGLNNDVTYYVRVYPVNSAKGGYYQSELTGQTDSAETFYFPNESLEYVSIGTYTGDQTITIDLTGWYEVSLYGAGGDGGRAATYTYNQREVCVPLRPDQPWSDEICTTEYSYNEGGGGGGGGGGAAVSRVKMKAGDTIVLHAGQPGNDTTAIINSSMEQYEELRVTSGTNGNNGRATGSSASGGTGGTGGQGYGGNLRNDFGTIGGTGGSVMNRDTESSGYEPVYPGSAGKPSASGGSYGGHGNGEPGEPGHLILYRGK